MTAAALRGPAARVFTAPALRRFELAWAGYLLAQWAFTAAIGVYAFDVAGATGVAIVTLVRFAPGLVASPLLGAVGDRFRRDRVIAATAGARGAGIAAAGALIVAGAPAELVFVAAAVDGIAAATFRPAHAALLPALARSADELASANAVASGIQAGAVCLGPLAGGALTEPAGVGGACLIAAVPAFAAMLSAARIARVPDVRVAREPDFPDQPGTPEQPGAGATDRPDGGGLLAGMRVLARADVWPIVAVFAVASLVFGVWPVAVVTVALEQLGTGDAGPGLLLAAFGFGGVVGAGVALLPPLRRHPLSALVVATACSGPPLAVIGLVTAPVVAGVLAAAFGAAGATVYACGQTLLQRRLPDEVLARGFAALQMVGMGGLALGTALTPVLIAAAGLKVTLAVTGALAPVSLLAFAAGGRSRRPTGEARRTSSPRPRPPG